jgi:hypothetical protein
MANPADIARVTELLGRAPQGDFDVVVRRADGDPVVVRNHPLLADGTPMPTLFWLVGRDEYAAVSRLEASGGVDQAEAEVDPDLLETAHRDYAALRNRDMPAGHTGPAPSAGVAGTRRGVKCLHAHFAWWLAGGNDPIGEWVARRIDYAAELRHV